MDNIDTWYCTIEGCTRTYKCRGLCGLHYNRLRRSGDPLQGGPVPPPLKKYCSVDECDRQHYAKSYCSFHYERWKASGDPLGSRRANTRRRLGYVPLVVWQPSPPEPPYSGPPRCCSECGVSFTDFNAGMCRSCAVELIRRLKPIGWNEILSWVGPDHEYNEFGDLRKRYEKVVVGDSVEYRCIVR